MRSQGDSILSFLVLRKHFGPDSLALVELYLLRHVAHDATVSQNIEKKLAATVNLIFWTSCGNGMLRLGNIIVVSKRELRLVTKPC